MRLNISKVYNQADPSWASALVGYNTDKRYNMKGYGCLICTLATYIKASGNRVATPWDLNELLKKVGGFVENTGLYIWSSLSKVYPEYELVEESKRYVKVPFPEVELNRVTTLLKEGYFILLEVDYSPTVPGEQMHFVGVVGIEDGKILIADPLTGTVDPLEKYGKIETACIAYKAYNIKVPIITPTTTTEEYPQVAILLWRALRVFVAGVLGALTVDTVYKLTDAKSFVEVKYLIALIVAGGVASLGKWLRDTYGNENKTSLFDKMPF